MKYFFLFLFLIICTVAEAQDKVFFETLPVPAGRQPSQDPSIPKISWNRWTTANFTVNSIDFDQGEYLFKNIELMKSWCLTRWGLPDIKFSNECRIFCAPNVETMKKLFNLDTSFGEVRTDGDGKLVISYLWIVFDGPAAQVVSPALTIVCLKEFNFKYRLNIGLWAYRGMAILNATVPQIKNNIVLAGHPDEFTAGKLFAFQEADWKKLSVEQKRAFDANASILCLLLRKEYGQRKFLLFLKFNNYENNLKEYLGFANIAAFNEVYNRFSINLLNDIKQNKTHDDYLIIEPVTK